jgi:hypothetical protein
MALLKIGRGIVAAAALAGIFASGQAEGGATAREWDLKAGFVYKIASFVHWPGSAFADGAAPLVIGIAGRDPSEGRLERMLIDKRIGGRRIAVIELPRPDAIGSSGPIHLLFIPNAEAAHVGALIERTRRLAVPTLTVSDSTGFASAGGMIALVPNGQHLGFEINRGAAEETGLKLSSALLSLAHIVTTERGAVSPLQ